MCTPALVAVEAESQNRVLDRARRELEVFAEEEARTELYQRGGDSLLLRCPQGATADARRPNFSGRPSMTNRPAGPARPGIKS